VWLRHAAEPEQALEDLDGGVAVMYEAILSGVHLPGGGFSQVALLALRQVSE
jgi:hypothetical protein